jgi:signal transduction histidine kinase
VKTNLKKQNILKIFVHVLSWIGVFILLDFSIPLEISDVPVGVHVKIFITVLIAAIVFYLNTQILIPNLLFKKRVAGYLITLVGILLMTYQLNVYVSSYLDFEQLICQMEDIIYEQERFEDEEYDEGEEDVPMILIVFALAFGVISSFAIQHYKREKEQEKIKQDRKEAELAFLKNQVNPHFFFNTLNNIYALIQIEPKKARETVLQLSQMMRYVLYESDEDRVTLKQELDFIAEYIGLMKIRLNEENEIVLNIDSTLNQEQKIPPLLYIPFIENAFKHGGDGNSNIYISIYQDANDVVLKVVNSVVGEKIETGGVGLTNVKKRLNLLFPLNGYDLKIQTRSEQFMVELRIRGLR